MILDLKPRSIFLLSSLDGLGIEDETLRDGTTFLVGAQRITEVPQYYIPNPVELKLYIEGTLALDYVDYFY